MTDKIGRRGGEKQITSKKEGKTPGLEYQLICHRVKDTSSLRADVYTISFHAEKVFLPRETKAIVDVCMQAKILPSSQSNMHTPVR